MFELVKRFVRCFCLLIALTGPALAQERPSWAITDAVDRLVAKNALFLPGRDGFLKFPDETLTQYELPSKNYLKDGKGWQVELLSRRWRKKEPQGWTAWNDARPQHGAWRIGVICVDVLASGVKATWVDNLNFSGATAPGEAEVTQKLDTLGQRNIASPAGSTYSSNVNPVQPVESATGQIFSTMPQPSPASGGLPSGMRRKIAQASTPVAPPIAAAVQRPASPVSAIPPVPLPVQAPQPFAAATVSPPALSFASTITILMFAFIIMSVLSRQLGKPKRQWSSRHKPGPTDRKSPPPWPAALPAPANNPLDLIQRTDNLLTPAELAFFAVLEPLVHSTHRISAKVRLADLFSAVQGPGQQTAFNKISRKHIDFVVTDSATSRILCGIELDDSSHNRPDRIERDRFVNELFARNQLPLLRVPFSWTYYPDGLREKLEKAGLILPLRA